MCRYGQNRGRSDIGDFLGFLVVGGCGVAKSWHFDLRVHVPRLTPSVHCLTSHDILCCQIEEVRALLLLAAVQMNESKSSEVTVDASFRIRY